MSLLILGRGGLILGKGEGDDNINMAKEEEEEEEMMMMMMTNEDKAAANAAAAADDNDEITTFTRASFLNNTNIIFC